MTNHYTREMFLKDMLNSELTAEQRECAEKWLAALGKKSCNSKEHALNEQLVAEAIKVMAAHADTPMSATQICAYVEGITSTQKAVAIMNLAAKQGLVERYIDKNRSLYRLIR